MYSDEFIKSIERFEKRISRPRSIFDVIDAIKFFAKSHQGITKAQRVVFENAKGRALKYISLFKLNLDTKFPADAGAKNKIWRIDIMPNLQIAREISKQENKIYKKNIQPLLPSKESAVLTSHRLKAKAKADKAAHQLPNIANGSERANDRVKDTQACSSSKTLSNNKAKENDEHQMSSSEYFTVLPDWIIESISKKKAFEWIPESVVDFAIEHRHVFGGWMQMPSKKVNINQSNIRQYIYLVFCELNTNAFYKVGLTKHKNPIRRDPDVYKRVISCHEVDCDLAHIYEAYCLWRCMQVRGKQPWDSVEFGWWAGKTEMIRSVDPSVETIYLEAYNEIDSAFKRLQTEQVLFEWHLLINLAKLIFDERYTTSSLAVYSAIDKIVRYYGEEHLESNEYIAVGLHPAASEYLTKRLVHQLAPIVDRQWDKLNIRCPLRRYHMGKLLYEELCYETWGESCWSKAKPYRHMTTYNLLHDSSKGRLFNILKRNIYKIFEKWPPAQKPPAQIADMKTPSLPVVATEKAQFRIIHYPERITITYQDIDGDITVRQISILTETLDTVEALCHLRNDTRTFNIWSILSVLEEDGSKCWGPKYFYNYRLNSHLDMKGKRGLDIDLLEDAAKIAAKITTRAQLAALEARIFKAEERISETQTDSAQANAHAKLELLLEASNIANSNKYDARYSPCLDSQDSLFLTLFQLKHVGKAVSLDRFRELRKSYPLLSNKSDWFTYSGYDIPGADSAPSDALKYLIAFRKIIEGKYMQAEQLAAIDLLACSMPSISNNYFNLRGKKKPSEQWLDLVAVRNKAGLT